MFTLDDEEKAKLEAWIASRTPATPENSGAIGGTYTYMFTPTTLGTVVKVRDNRDGAEVDLTDYRW